MKTPGNLREAFDPDLLRRQGREVIELLALHLEQALNQKRSFVLPNISPESMLDRWRGGFKTDPQEALIDVMKRVLDDANNLHHPKYMGHQCCGPLPAAALSELLNAFLNNGSAVYEMGPVNVAMEKRLIQWMSELIGYDKSADGVFTNGGTLGNLTAFLAGLHVKNQELKIWEKGIDRADKLALLTSEQCHYSVKRSAAIAGLGEDSVIPVPVDNGFHIDLAQAERCHAKAIKDGRKVFMIVANSGTTATGTCDDLVGVADFAKKHDLWMHVDAAHGASALLSEKYRHRLAGIDRADSMVWDAHKMLMIPALTTAVIFKNGRHSYAPFSQNASYLFEKSAEEEWYNLAHRTLECTKTMLGIKLYVPLAACGTRLFADYVTYTYDLAADFAEEIDKRADFELLTRPESNIVCFRHRQEGAADLNARQRHVRRELLKGEKFYLTQTMLNGKIYLRCTLINPNTTTDDLTELLDEIRNIR